MDKIVAEIKDCRKCRLWKHAKNPVPGEGDLDTPLMFVGEAPGSREDAVGRPFVGSAGKLLDGLLSGIDLKREEVYISNIVKHRPPENRDPKSDEIETCTPYLEKQIQIIRPDIIVTLGRYSTGYIFSKANLEFKGLTGIRGRIFDEKLLGLPVRIIPIIHPAAVLYRPAYRVSLEEDFRTIKTELEKLI